MYTDAELLSLLRNAASQQRAFEAIVKQYGEKLYWQVRRLVLSHEDADDIVQNAFIKAWLNINAFEGKAKISTWLSRIAINEALDFLRKRQKSDALRASDDVLSVASQLIADEYFDGDQTQAQLQEAISLLPDVQRTVFTLRYFDEMKYSEMSQILGTSEGSLKASYHHAVKKIENFFNNLD